MCSIPPGHRSKSGHILLATAPRMVTSSWPQLQEWSHKARWWVVHARVNWWDRTVSFIVHLEAVCVEAKQFTLDSVLVHVVLLASEKIEPDLVLDFFVQDEESVLSISTEAGVSVLISYLLLVFGF